MWTRCHQKAPPSGSASDPSARSRRPGSSPAALCQLCVRAIARGLAYQPDVLLMDEPFAAVDAQTRIELEDLVLRIRRQYDTTVLFVTHDIDEAVYLADRVIVLSGAPTRVRENIAIDLPWPRDQVDTKALPRYAELRTRVFTLIQEAKAASPSAADDSD